METYFMSKKEIDQAQVLKMVQLKHITQKDAGDILNLSTRQIRRKLKEFIINGIKSLFHKSKGKVSNRKTSEYIESQIVKLMKSKYIGFGPTLASEKLFKEENIKIDHDILRKILIKNNLFDYKPRKIIKRIRREQKHHKGELVQLDGSYHMWIAGKYWTLIVFVDDATKEVFCRFYPESTIGIAQATLEYIKKYGRPLRFYTDNGKVFKTNTMTAKAKGSITQFRRMLNELNIEIQFANSPQAKGRVERANRTLQDRLAKELRLKNITNIHDANGILEEFLIDYNSRFTIKPKSSASLFRSLEGYDLNSIFCYKYKRIINNDNTISFENRCMLLSKKQKVLIKPKNCIDVYKAFDHTISLWKNGVKLIYTEIIKPLKINNKEKVYNNNPVRWKPPVNHFWRSSFKDWFSKNRTFLKSSK